MCQSPLRLIALVKTEAVMKKILVAMHPVPSEQRASPLPVVNASPATGRGRTGMPLGEGKGSQT
jgi:hypothetical protein